ncbi:MAG: HAMP domain-containing sensor histidine kinase [Ignavibacteriaceae bacterium]
MSEVINKEMFQQLLEELELKNNIIKDNAEEIEQLNKKIIEFENILTDNNHNKAKLYSILSHDLRSPFNGLLGFANFLMEEAESLSPDEIKTFTSNISSSAKGLLELIDKVFEWIKMDIGNYDYAPSNIDLKYLVDEVFFLYRKKADEKQVKLNNNIPGNTSAYGDHEMIRRVVEHLLSNSIKFIPNNGEINVTSEISGEEVELSVRDNGIGMSKTDMDKLFRTDKKISTRGTANEKGPGLGLLISKKVMEINNGKIRAESEEGKGSTFTITLPKQKQ